jgi:4-amino-4-deoxy-L-arabinose transferase-like glycosyltransferase
LSFGFETERRLSNQCVILQRHTSELERAHTILFSRKLSVIVGLALLIFLQLVILGRTFSEFLTPDAIYYIARPIGNIETLTKLFTSLDDTQNYRPLAYVLATPVYWIAGLQALPYHIFAFGLHVLVTLLVFFLARELLNSAKAALVSAFFFGLHTAASHVAFDVTFVADAAYGAFYILGLFLWLRARPLPLGEGGRRPGEGASGSAVWRNASVAAFVLSLLSKEPAVTFPATVTLLTFLLFNRDGSEAGISARLRLALRQTRVFWIIAVVYLAGFGLLSSSRFVPSDPDHPYRFSLAAEDLLSKHRYAEWAVNIYPAYDTMEGHPTIVGLAARVLPQSLAQRFAGMSDFYLYLVGPLWLLWLGVRGQWGLIPEFFLLSIETPLRVLSIVALVYFIVRSALRREERILFGLALFLLPLVPVLLLRADKTMPHNLYVPAVGISLIVGNYSLIQWRRRTRGRRFLAMTVPAVLVVMGVHAVQRQQDDGWPTSQARALRAYLDDVVRLYPTLPEGTILYFEKTGDPGFPYAAGRGDVFRVYYGRPELATVFADHGQEISNVAANQTVIRLQKVDGHLAPSVP